VVAPISRVMIGSVAPVYVFVVATICKVMMRVCCANLYICSGAYWQGDDEGVWRLFIYLWWRLLAG
jgi:hypothetical protein